MSEVAEPPKHANRRDRDQPGHHAGCSVEQSATDPARDEHHPEGFEKRGQDGRFGAHSPGGPGRKGHEPDHEQGFGQVGPAVLEGRHELVAIGEDVPGHDGESRVVVREQLA